MKIAIADAINKYKLTDTIEHFSFYHIFLNAEKKFFNITDLPQIDEGIVNAILNGNGEQVKTEGGGMYWGMHSATIYDFGHFVILKWQRNFFATPFGSKWHPDSSEGIIIAPVMTDGVRNKLTDYFDGRNNCYRVIK